MGATRFKDANRQRAYEAALAMHETLMREGSGRGIAYRRGWEGRGWDLEWLSYPIYCAGRDNRKTAQKIERRNAAQ